MPPQLLTRLPEQQHASSSAPRIVPVHYDQAKLPPPILKLQRVLGNSQLARLIQTKRINPQGEITGIQRKLTVGAANDQYEQEADHVARQVMSMPDSVGSLQRDMPTEEDKDKVLRTKPLAESITPLVQRELENRGKMGDKEEDKEKETPVQAKSAGFNIGLRRERETEEEEQKPIQAHSIQRTEARADSFDAGEEVESKLNSSKGGGSPLPDSVRGYMEPRFGMDFSHVRVHTGPEAIQLNRDVGAKAFTLGSDIYYGAGHTPANLELTAHELTHVVQQTGSVPLIPLHAKRMDGANRDNPAVMRICSECAQETRENKENEESALKSFTVQRTIGDGHDFPPASRFSGNVTLEDVFDNHRVVESGSSGAPVTLVQQALINLGYQLPRFGVDGQFGDETRRAVDAFQRDVGLAPDKLKLNVQTTKLPRGIGDITGTITLAYVIRHVVKGDKTYQEGDDIVKMITNKRVQERITLIPSEKIQHQTFGLKSNSGDFIGQPLYIKRPQRIEDAPLCFDDYGSAQDFLDYLNRPEAATPETVGTARIGFVNFNGPHLPLIPLDLTLVKTLSIQPMCQPR
jgi:hypothetical protein